VELVAATCAASCAAASYFLPLFSSVLFKLLVEMRMRECVKAWWKWKN
jgi:hypothetical protein